MSEDFLSGPCLDASSGTETRYCCPFCLERIGKADHNYHLYLHDCDGRCMKCKMAEKDLRGFYFCHRCSAAGRVNFEPEGDCLENWDEDVDNFLHPRKAPGAEQLELPVTGKITRGLEAYEYLKKRGIGEDLIDYYGISLGLDRLRGRVVVPDLNQNLQWNYWVARDYTGSSTIRYVAPPQRFAVRQKQVFHLDRIDEDTIFITEGVFSAIAVGKEAVALYGKYVFDSQIQRMVEKGINYAYCVLDPDAVSWNWELGKQLTSWGIEAYIVRLPDGKDPADLGRDLVMSYADKAQLWTEEGSLLARLEGV